MNLLPGRDRDEIGKAMLSRARLASGVGLLLCVLVGAFMLWRWWHRPMPPLQIGVWYWHHPFALPEGEARQLRAAGVTQLYVRAGTFIRDQDRVRVTLRQSWTTGAPGLETHLVYNFDYSVVRSYSQLDAERTAQAVVAEVRQGVARARHAGLRPAGVQFDFDCATRSLPRYARLLKRLRRDIVGLNGVRLLSVTALPTWYTSPDVRKVADAVDFMVPQYYEPRIGPTLERYATISCLPMVRQGMGAAAALGHPFYVGLPAYGHALMYDDRGGLVGLYRDMNVREAAEHRSFRLARAYAADLDGKPATSRNAIGEDLLDFVATRPADSGRGLGYHLLYDLPTPELLAQHLALVRAERPRECRGVILFCYPEPETTLALPLPTLCATLRGQPTEPRLTVHLTVRKAPWELIETDRKAAHPPVNLAVTVTNTGTANTFLAADAVTLTLHFDRPGLDEVDPRDFDGYDSEYVGMRENGPEEEAKPIQNPAEGTVPSPANQETGRLVGGMRCSLPRADTLEVRKFQLLVGETARLGPIRVPADGATRVWGTWSIRRQGGFATVTGDIPPTALAASAGQDDGE
jgi:hypothetical protein